MAQADTYNPYLYQPMMQYYYGVPHETAVMQLALWMKDAAPGAFTQIVKTRPDLLDGNRAVRSGTMSGLAGMGSLAQAADDEPTNPVTTWGQSLFELAKGYMAYDSQKELLKVNLARAEKGLPPISSYDLAPTLNMGIAPPVLTLGYVAIGGLMIAGLAMAFKRK